MKQHAVSPKHLLPLKAYPLLFLLVFIPGLNPAAFMTQIADWSYLHFLRNSMEIDRLFTAAFPGVRELFATNAFLIFSGYASLVLVVFSILFSFLSLLVHEKTEGASLLTALRLSSESAPFHCWSSSVYQAAMEPLRNLDWTGEGRCIKGRRETFFFWY